MTFTSLNVHLRPNHIFGFSVCTLVFIRRLAIVNITWCRRLSWINRCIIVLLTTTWEKVNFEKKNWSLTPLWPSRRRIVNRDERILHDTSSTNNNNENHNGVALGTYVTYVVIYARSAHAVTKMKRTRCPPACISCRRRALAPVFWVTVVGESLSLSRAAEGCRVRSLAPSTTPPRAPRRARAVRVLSWRARAGEPGNIPARPPVRSVSFRSETSRNVCFLGSRSVTPHERTRRKRRDARGRKTRDDTVFVCACVLIEFSKRFLSARGNENG